MIKTNTEQQKKKTVATVTDGVDTVTAPDEVTIENTVRPSRMSEIIGRAKEKQKITMMIDSARKRKDKIDHILFYGPPGLGKTTFAMAIANEIGSALHVTSGPAIQKQGDLATILTNLKEKDVLFIDEIHRLSRGVEEILYPAMEDGKLDIVLGKGISAKTVRLTLKQFTLIGATTRIGLISSPMRDRFGLIQRLDYFTNDELSLIVNRGAGVWGIKIDPEAIGEIARRARGTARIALRMLRRVRDYFDSFSGDSVTGSTDEQIIPKNIVMEALDLLGVDEYGLEDIDRKILSTMLLHFDGGPVGLSTLAASVSEEIGTIADVYEPYLMQCGLMKRTGRGRVLTEAGVAYARKNSDAISRFA